MVAKEDYLMPNDKGHIPTLNEIFKDKNNT